MCTNFLDLSKLFYLISCSYSTIIYFFIIIKNILILSGVVIVQIPFKSENMTKVDAKLNQVFSPIGAYSFDNHE
ncbi:hypothetical protein BpHYR1_018187 [Brachionus plicatilis]|uniref:Uncharacterized protein n=1 Tax=Brachionus plicatilis TaxID=10195 RepID=A0A3M7Q5T5_BRAPC|nr:hypothetical protein BpHYR1_018187 [Brachionus plicatilis]